MWRLARPAEKDESESDEEFVEQIIKKLEIIFSGSVKLKIYFAGMKPYRWEMISNKPENKISSFNITGLMFYNYFARKAIVEKKNILI
ncbi:MAG: hypothetical protein NTY12_01815 [Candidatus Falkowbacteria bacterium]|nr:hypothetical protein [Candidatus Falkowbacteria bacterium]